MRRYHVDLRSSEWRAIVQQCGFHTAMNVTNEIEKLGDTPFRPGNRTSVDEEERAVQVSKLAGCEITYWADHAARTVRVTKIKWLEEAG